MCTQLHESRLCLLKIFLALILLLLLAQNSLVVQAESTDSDKQDKSHLLPIPKKKPIPGSMVSYEKKKSSPVKNQDTAISQEPAMLQGHFAEIEVVLDDMMTLEDLDSLPQAPGSKMELLDGGKRALVQLPAVIVGDLIEKGIPLTVHRDFMLVRKMSKSFYAESLGAASDSCSGEYASGSNDTDYAIPLMEWIYSGIDIDHAPANAVVTCVDVHYEIIHTFVSDLQVDLANEDISLEHRLWNEEGGSSDNISETVSGIEAFAGQPVNQRWRLWAIDTATGDTGYIDDWWIKVYYMVCPDMTCSGPFVSETNEVDYPIPLLDWTHSDIALDGAPAQAYVNCVDAYFEVRHTWIGDLVVDLGNESLSREHRLWDEEGGSSDNISKTVTGIKMFTNEHPNQIWGLWAMDRVPSDEGYIDNWWIKVYYGYEPVTVEHDLCENAARIEEGFSYNNTTAGATGQYETACGRNDFNDVWHVYTASRTGLATVSVSCTNFDTTLAVFDQCAGSELACNDDTCDSTDSEITLVMTGGTDYLIRVAGYQEEIGDYTLTVTQEPNVLPEEPNLPRPSVDANDVSTDVVLAWNGWIGQTIPAISGALTNVNLKDSRQAKSIYGKDDRLEEYQITDPAILSAGDATVVILRWSDLSDNGDGTYTLPRETLAEWYEWVDPLWTGNSLCPDVPFRDQPAVGRCTGVLVAPDIVATTGNCIECQDISDIVVVFGFVMLDELKPRITVGAENVYGCASIIGRQDGYPSWSLVRLERMVTNHVPLPLRKNGKVADNEPLLAIGHPLGLPRKYDMGGMVRENSHLTFFQANVDTFVGSSGSPVINLNSMEVEGLLVRGNQDFMEDVDMSCDRLYVCSDANGCTDRNEQSWEDVTRATAFSDVVPVSDVYIGTDPNHLEQIAKNLVVPYYYPMGLQANTTYYWRVKAKNISGEIEGPVWFFTTGSDEQDELIGSFLGSKPD